jgi:hypothetical protein
LAFATVDTVLTQAQAELGLSQTSFAATDAVTVQVVALLTKAGRALAREDWSALTKRYSFTPTATGPYDLPADYRTMIPQTGWDTTTQVPLVGPLTEQQWELFVARLGAGNAVGTPFRTWLGKLYLYPETNFPASHTVAFEYRSSWWVGSSSTATTADAPSAGADTIFFDADLIVAALKLAWKREKGFDSTTAQQDFELLLAQAKLDDADAPILNLGGVHGPAARLIGASNAPETGFGS